MEEPTETSKISPNMVIMSVLNEWHFGDLMAVDYNTPVRIPRK